jgi:hypothetical protein
MGTSDNYGLVDFNYDTPSQRLRLQNLYPALACLPFVFVAVCVFNLTAGIVGLILTFTLNAAIHYLAKRKTSVALGAISSLSTMLWCSRRVHQTLVKAAAPATLLHNPILTGIDEGCAMFGRIGGALTGAVSQQAWFSELDTFREYSRILFLSQVRQYNRVMDFMVQHHAEFRSYYRCFGELDLALAVLSFRKSLPFWTAPTFTDDRAVRVEELYHPLLTNPVTNTVDLTQDSLFSGSNASGKSTFIKAIALSGILAQTINTCPARSYRARLTLVATSMAARDSLVNGESYFIAEIKSLRRLVALAHEAPCILVIDEILKGTNTTERIAASVAILQALAPLDCLCLVATHDIELPALLASNFANYHFEEQVTERGVDFDYRLRPGPTNTRNAIRLLKTLDFEDTVIQKATALVSAYEKSGMWEPGERNS